MNDVTRVNKAGLKAVEESTDENPAFEKKVKSALSVCYRKFKKLHIWVALCSEHKNRKDFVSSGLRLCITL